MVRFHNTLTRQVEPLEPLEPPRVGIYACGPTVYDYAHIGNFRTFLWFDLVHRVLEWRGHDVELVLNLTDVDDNTIGRARREGVSLGELTERYIEAFHEDMETLRIRPATRFPRATEHVDDMAALIDRLLERGVAYRSDGSIYFHVDAFPDYGRLARLDPDELRATGRAEADADLKRDPRDFALWKAPKDDEPSWDTLVGPGRPGWHIECSAMSMKYLGPRFDLHLGGVDLIFPHHENELAQSVAATGEQFARMWLHCAHLVVDGTKMSKSLGNQYTLRDLLERGEDPVAIRYLLGSVHYRKQLNFTWDALARADSAVTRLREFVVRAEQALPGLPEGRGASAARPDAGGSAAGAASGGGQRDDARGPRDRVSRALEEARHEFAACLEDDLNISGALGALFTLVREANTALDKGEVGAEDLRAALGWIREVDDAVLDVLPPAEELVERQVEVGDTTLRAVGPPLGDDLVELVVRRMRARAERDFDAADRMRHQLQEQGVVVEDTADGVRWHVTG